MEMINYVKDVFFGSNIGSLFLKEQQDKHQPPLNLCMRMCIDQCEFLLLAITLISLCLLIITAGSHGFILLKKNMKHYLSSRSLKVVLKSKVDSP